MRRGHSGIGGWRNENPRHFRPRGHGPPHFRPSRPYGLLDAPGFPPNTPRPHRPPHHYINQSDHGDNHRQQDHERNNNYRINNIQRNNDRHPPRSSYHPHHQQIPQTPHNDTFYMDVNPDTRINSLGDVDHRQTPYSNNQSYNHQPQWSNPQDHNQHYYDDRSPHKSYRQHDQESNRIPTIDYGGHRPPASDHYGTPSTTTNNNDTSFSRSVDDTVDIVRRRLMNRNEPQMHQDTTNMGGSEQDMERPPPPAQHDQPKRRIQKQRQTVKANCDKMKSNIVHQLFKMDKDKIHKLMDNPSSSSKFEYAISSLITESQNTLNRHLRSVAEKSLCSTSREFIHQDNNTIYEDTFMKQMQCILDPQDTVLLEDIKPIVMEELCKLLEIDNYDQRMEVAEDMNAPATSDYPDYPGSTPYNYEDYPQDAYYDQHQMDSYDNSEEANIPTEVNDYDYNTIPPVETKPLFERRPRSYDHSEEKKLSAEQRRISLESQRLRKSSEHVDEPLPLFDTNAEDVSESEDPFAGLDLQYHVPVNHDFLEEEISESPTPSKIDRTQNDPVVKQEIDNQLFNLAKSPIKLFSATPGQEQKPTVNLKQEVLESPDFPKENSTPCSNSQPNAREHVNIKREHISELKEMDRYESSSRSRKRSIDQKPSHRKEKRKKSESHSEPNRSFEYNSEGQKCIEKPDDTSKHYFSIFSPKTTHDSVKDCKKDTSDKAYTEKYVKRKNSQSRSKERERGSSKNRHSSSSSQNIVSPRDNNKTPTKSDSKTKLKSIDIFVDPPKKGSVHHAHRNTAPTPKPNEEPRPKVLTHAARKSMPTRSVSTQVFKKVHGKETQTLLSKSSISRFVQTEKKKHITRFAQTDPVKVEKSQAKATDAFERMKEIDMEIQVLLQEKFKLYSSLESKESCSSSMPTLGMTVLNVAPVEEIKEEEEHSELLSADSIVDDFTSIPVEELEQIALETVQEEHDLTNKPNRHNKLLQQERKKSQSPNSKRKNKKTKTPNISLIEQIITDDRPLDDIICLDDLEKPLVKSKKKSRNHSKKKSNKKSKGSKQMLAQIARQHKLRECSVVMVQLDMKRYLNKKAIQNEQAIEETKNISVIEIQSEEEETNRPPSELLETVPQVQDVEISETKSEPTQEVDQNDIQFDMLDVSEDIVIGESCEIKTQNGRDVNDRDLNLSEEIILDNSQSSADDAVCEAGQLEAECKMYDYSADEKLRRDTITVTGNSDAVLAIECLENGFIAACLDGNVYHFSGEGHLMNTMRGSSLAVTCLTIVKEPHGTTIYTGSLDSRIRYYDLESGLEKGPECNVLSPIQTMDRAWDTVFVGTRTGFVLQFECKNNMLIPVSTVKFSEQSILALRALKEGPRKVLLVAARSELVTVKDAQTGLLLRTLHGPAMTVYTLLFEDSKVYCGTSTHQIHMFDYATGAHNGCHLGGKGAVCLRAAGGLLFAGCYDGCVYVFRDQQPRPLAQLRGPGLMLLSLAVQGSKVIAGYKDRGLYIWKIPLSILQEMIL